MSQVGYTVFISENEIIDSAVKAIRKRMNLEWSKLSKDKSKILTEDGFSHNGSLEMHEVRDATSKDIEAFACIEFLESLKKS